MMGNGRKETNMELALLNLLMEAHTRGNIRKANFMEKELLYTLIQNLILEVGFKENL